MSLKSLREETGKTINGLLKTLQNEIVTLKALTAQKKTVFKENMRR